MAPTILLGYAKEQKLNKIPQDNSSTMMGKSQKFSKGYSSEFVPDYHHAVETMGESEGFGSSGRADSEDSCTPKRKCISLNVDGKDRFNVPLQVISLSKISASERKDLEKRLRVELERIQILQKKIFSGAVGVDHPPSTASHRDRNNTGSHTASQLKRGVSGRFESVKRDTPASTFSNANALLMKQCETLLKRLRSHKYGWVFNEPVDAVKLGIPDYHTVIKQPMDLGTIKKKLISGAYSSPWAFVSDVRLTFTNALTYNPPANNVHIMADTLSKFFEERWKSIEKKLSAPDSVVPTVKEYVKSLQQSKKRKAPPTLPAITPPASNADVKNKLTREEKNHLLNQLYMLGDLPENISDFLKSQTESAKQTSEEEIEIDTESLSDEALFELRKLLDDYLEGKKLGNTMKAEDHVVEVLNESGVSNACIHPCEVIEPAEEDVDIGGNDPPISSYPPVEIEKDTVGRNNGYSSSSSSSSDSSSSSSDSDTASSSGSESNVKDSAPTNDIKHVLQEYVKFDALDQDKSDVMNPVEVNNLPEQNIYIKVDSLTEIISQEGENAPSERQVSPEKRIRMALLKSRFADTILKAREKTLDKADKSDPEKLRREKEELERQKREEKARIQAEAKAAEEACRQAEVAAAAEARQTRELEREAARQALLKIEKTVEINENSQILKDLEMLRAAPTEQIPSSVDETSPDHSQEGIGSFKLGGSNPLEQLGLYMKEDDDEEEEVEATGIPLHKTEDEEGEVDV